MNEYNVDSSAVTDDELDAFITEAVDQVLFGECAYQFAHVESGDDYCTTYDAAGECTAWEFCYYDSSTNTDICSDLDQWCYQYDGTTCTGWSDPADPDSFCTTWDDATGECTAWYFCTTNGATGAEICSDWAQFCTAYDADGVTCTAFIDPTDTDYDPSDFVDDPDAYCSTWDNATGECTAWQFCTYDSATDTDICAEWDSYCTAYDSDGVTCIGFTDPTDPDSYCTTWDDATGECTAWQFCTFDNATNTDICSDWAQLCTAYDADGVTCIEFTDPAHDPDTYCSTWDNATGDCTGWLFCTYDSATNTDVCAEWDSYCTSYDADGVTCLAFTDPYEDSADDVCVSYDTDGSCLQWGYDLEDYCVTWNDNDASVCEVYNFCITQTDGTELCTSQFDHWCADIDANGNCTGLVVMPIDDFCTNWDANQVCDEWNFCITLDDGTETCTNYYDDWCVNWDTNGLNCIEIVDPASTECVFDNATNDYICPEGCWYAAGTDETLCYLDDVTAQADCAEFTDDGQYCITDWYEYYAHARECLPNEPLLQYVQLIEQAFFENLTNTVSTDYIDYTYVDTKAVLKALMDNVTGTQVDSGLVDTSGNAIMIDVADRVNSGIATVVESVGLELFANANGPYDPVQYDWWAAEDAGNNVSMGTLYDIYDAIAPIPFLTADEYAWKASSVNVADKLFEYASYQYGHDYSSIMAVVDLYSLNSDFKAMIDLAMSSLSWTNNPADVTIGEIDAVVAMVHTMITDMSYTADYFGLTDAIIQDYVYEVVNDILYGENVCYLTGWSACLSTEYYDASSDSCIEIPPCYPWEYLDNSGTNCIDDSANYQGDVCDFDTEYWDWELWSCESTGYGCMPWELETAAGECIDDPNYSGVECTDTEYYDFITLQCLTTPNCLPWEIEESDGTCTDDSANYTGGEICDATQYWDWSDRVCYTIEVNPCYEWEYLNDNGVCVEDPYYTGVVCEDWEELIDGVCIWVEPVIDIIWTYPAYEMLHLIQGAFLDGQSTYIEYVDVHTLEPQPIIALLKANTNVLEDANGVKSIDTNASTQGMVAEVGMQLNNGQMYDTVEGFDDNLINTARLLEVAQCAYEAEWANANDLQGRLAAIDTYAVTEQYLLYEFGLDSTIAAEQGIDLTVFPFETWATMAINSITWEGGQYTVGEMAAIEQAVYDILNQLNLSSSDLGIDDASIQAYVHEIVTQVLYGTCVDTIYGDPVIDEGCTYWDEYGNCLDYSDEVIWGCIELDAAGECISWDYVTESSCITRGEDGICQIYYYVDPYEQYETDAATDYGDDYFILDPKMQITQFGAEYLTAPSGIDAYDPLLIDWFTASDDAAVTTLMNNMVWNDEWTWPWVNVDQTDVQTVVDAVLLSLYNSDAATLGVDINTINMNEIALIADRLSDAEWYEVDHHFETFRYLNVEALIVQYAEQEYGIPADTLYSVVDLSLINLNPAVEHALNSMTWTDHVYEITEMAYVRQLFTDALTQATGLPADFFNLADAVIDEFAYVIIDQVLYGSIANEFWNLSLDTWEDVYTGTTEEFAEEQQAWTRDLDMVWQIAESFFYGNNMLSEQYVDFNTIDPTTVINELLASVTWIDENVSPRTVDRDNTRPVELQIAVGAKLLQDQYAITDIPNINLQLVDMERLYTLADDFEYIESLDTAALTNILNGLDLNQFILDYTEHKYGVTPAGTQGVINLIATELEPLAITALESVTWQADGSYTIDALDTVRADVYTYIDTNLVNELASAVGVGVSDERIDDFINALVSEVIYGSVTEYVPTGFAYWLSDIEIEDVVRDIILDRFDITEADLTTLFTVVDVWDLAYDLFDHLEYYWDETYQEDIYWITDAKRADLHTRALEYITTSTVDLSSIIPTTGVTDADIDRIIDATIQYVAFGDPSDFNDDQWLAYMTDLVTNENLTEEELIDFLQYQQEGWTQWMINNPIEYENWLADYGDALETFSAKYLTTIEQYITDPAALELWEEVDDPIDNWEESAAEVLTPAAQAQFADYQLTEGFYNAQPRKAEWDALKDSLTEIYWSRVSAGKESNGQARLAQAEPALLAKCDPDRKDLGESMWTQANALVFKKADLIYMQDFLDRVDYWIWEEYYARETANSSGILI